MKPSSVEDKLEGMWCSQPIQNPTLTNTAHDVTSLEEFVKDFPGSLNTKLKRSVSGPEQI